MDVITSLKLAEITIQAIEKVMSEKDSPMSTGSGKIIGVNSIIQRYNYYKVHPEQIPPYIIEEMNV